jgi:Family of unknown function (DUF6498)
MTIETAIAKPPHPHIVASASRLVTLLISNGIPLLGVWYYGWSATNVLVLYWLESLLVAVFTCLRIGTHCRLTRRRGHWRKDQLSATPGEIGTSPTMLRDYAMIAVTFTLAHGIFVAAIAFILARNHPGDPVWQFAAIPFRQGASILSGMLLIDFCVDRATLSMRAFAWIRIYTQQRMGRVLILHLAIIGGMFAMAATQSPFGVLYALIALKTLWDLAMSRVSETPADTPENPPTWLLKMTARVAREKGGAAALQEEWTRNRAAARQRGIEDELPMPR